MAGEKVAYRVGKVHIFAKKDGSHTKQEVSCVSVDDFDSALATDVAELDMAGKYTKFAYHNEGQ